MIVVIVLELLAGLLQFLDGLEGCDPEQIFLECPDEALGTAVPFGGADKGRRGCRSQPGDLVLKIVADVLRAVVMADGQASGHVRADRPEAFPHALADRLKRLEARAPRGGMDANAACRAMIDRDKDSDSDLTPCSQKRGGHICAPHLVDTVRDDGPVMGAGTVCWPSAGLRTQPVLAHEPRRTRACEVPIPL